jgi:hypothetical protein
MGLNLETERDSARRVLHEALASRGGALRHVRSLRGNARSTAPLPVYRLSAPAALSSRPLARARRIGWVYLIVGGERPALATVLERRKSLLYAGISEGLLAQRLIDAVELAHERYKAEQRVVRVRILQVPSARLTVLWLAIRGLKSEFIALSVNHVPPGNSPTVSPDLHRLLHP